MDEKHETTEVRVAVVGSINMDLVVWLHAFPTPGQTINAKVSLDSLARAESLMASCHVLMLQLETPVETVVAASELARRHQIPGILGPAPASASYPQALLQVDLLCPNESEASTPSGLPVTNFTEAQAAALWLHRAGAKNVAITLGSAGTCLLSEEGCQLIEPYVVQAVDSTAAGDAFAGALAVRWLQTGKLQEAVSFANAAGALATSRRGAQTSMAIYSDIQTLRATKP